MTEPTSFKPDHYQELALKTWYSPDDPRYLDPRHPLIKLAGEAGEILDLFGKHEYKPGFSWWDCKICGQASYDIFHGQEPNSHTYTPKVLDELGDWFYYARIVTFQQGISIAEWILPSSKPYDTAAALSEINLRCAKLLNGYLVHGDIGPGYIRTAFNWFCSVLIELDCTIDHLTELNYAKLNSAPGAHGWKAG